MAEVLKRRFNNNKCSLLTGLKASSPSDRFFLTTYLPIHRSDGRNPSDRVQCELWIHSTGNDALRRYQEDPTQSIGSREAEHHIT